MEIRLAENIRSFRKTRKLTQEQLAEAMMVSVAAVSKWELGSSIPDIAVIMELADFFETSVDVLLGYEWRRHSAGETAERLRSLRLAKALKEGMVEAEKALQKYPNSFDVVYQSAMLYYVALDKKSAQRALTLLQRALELIDQNSDDQISSVSIQNHISACYQLLGRFDEAIELLKKNNFDRHNDPVIGSILSCNCEKYEEALPYLSNALGDCQINLFRVVVGYVNSYVNTGHSQLALEITLWLLEVNQGFKLPGKVTFIDKGDAVMWALCASIAMELGQADHARIYLKNARDTALRFDADPQYSMANLKYYYDDQPAAVFDDIGDTALDGVLKYLQKSEQAAMMMAIWEELCNEK